MDFEVLEKMLVDYDKLYESSKIELSSKLHATVDLSERKQILDDFFGKLESESYQIKNSHIYRAFKNTFVSGKSI